MGRFTDSVPDEITVEYGDTAVINLPPIDSYPKPAIAWETDDHTMVWGDLYITDVPGKLVILSVTKEHEKSYRYLHLAYDYLELPTIIVCV